MFDQASPPRVLFCDDALELVVTTSSIRLGSRTIFIRDLRSIDSEVATKGRAAGLSCAFVGLLILGAFYLVGLLFQKLLGAPGPTVPPYALILLPLGVCSALGGLIWALLSRRRTTVRIGVSAGELVVASYRDSAKARDLEQAIREALFQRDKGPAPTVGGHMVVINQPQGSTFAGFLNTTSGMPGEASGQGQRAVLLLFANSSSQEALRLQEEDRAITEAIQLSKHREAFRLARLHAGTADDLHRALINERPEILHVSAHGQRGGGLILAGPAGEAYVVSIEKLNALLLPHFSPGGHLTCVLLNACFTSIGANSQLAAEFSILMEGSVRDSAAIEFSRGFYDAIGGGLNPEQAYLEGRARARIKGHELAVRFYKSGRLCQLE